MLCALNGHTLQVAAGEAIGVMMAVAAGELGEAEVAEWLSARLAPREPGSASS